MRQGQTTEKIFFGVAIFNIFITYVILVASKGNFMYELTYSESNFCDLWDHIWRLLSSRNIYTTDADAIFPPLAYLFLKIFAYPLIYKVEAGDDFWKVSQSGYGILMVVMYLILFIWLLTIAVRVYYRTGTFMKESALLGQRAYSEYDRQVCPRFSCRCREA